VGEREENMTMDDQRLGRLGELIDEKRFDVAALVWMLCILIFVGCQIYTVLKLANAGFGSSAWDKVAALSQTGGPLVAASCGVGIALALWFDTANARFALWLAALGGAWVLVAGALQIVSAVHESDSTIGFLALNQQNRAVSALAGLAFAGLGLIVALVAGRFARAPTAPDLS
jgi:hypothetical protein